MGGGGGRGGRLSKVSVEIKRLVSSKGMFQALKL